MSTTFVKQGNVLEFTAPTGGVTNGTPLFVGGFFVIPRETALVGVRFDGYITGVHALPRTASETWLEGESVWWDITNGKATVDPTVGLLPIGSVEVAGASTDATGVVRLNGVSHSGRVFPLRRRVPVATINAGGTLLPAIPGVSYRLHDAAAIAVGGAVTSNTTADVKGVQATSTVKLVAFTQAALTQSALVRAGSAGGTLLSDGASFAKCDVNTAITVGNTGSAITVATNVDFLLTVSLE